MSQGPCGLDGAGAVLAVLAVLAAGAALAEWTAGAAVAVAVVKAMPSGRNAIAEAAAIARRGVRWMASLNMSDKLLSFIR